MIKFFKKIFDLIFILMIIILGTYFVLRYTNQVMIYRVKTGSMEDNIHVGDYILIIRKDEYNVGDVVTFEKDDGFITHRIIKKDGNTIITKGDANNVEDGIIDRKKIVGKVIISGGIINIIIVYKYALVGFLLSLYLFSCFFDNANKKENVATDEQSIAINDDEILLTDESEEQKEVLDDESDEVRKEDDSCFGDDANGVEEDIEQKEEVNNKEVSNEVENNKKLLEEDKIEETDGISDKNEEMIPKKRKKNINKKIKKK